jgi:hypothetical protein
MTGESEFNEVFLSDVFVPTDQLIGEENNAGALPTRPRLRGGVNPRQQVLHTSSSRISGTLPTTSADDDETARELRTVHRVRIFQLNNLRVLSRLAKGGEPGPQGIGKLYWAR